MKKGFTIIEVSILFVVFLIVAFLVAPITFDDTIQARNTSKWKNVQQDFINIAYTVNNRNEEKEEEKSISDEYIKLINEETKKTIRPYKISYIKHSNNKVIENFDEFQTTIANATVAVKFYELPKDEIIGILMYDVNGIKKPNTWGKDVFGYNIYKDHFEPFCKREPIAEQRRDCSRRGTGLCCSNYYLIGGDFE